MKRTIRTKISTELLNFISGKISENPLDSDL